MASVRRAGDVLTGAQQVRFEVATGSHLGVLSSPNAQDTTWRHLDDFLAEVAIG